MNEIVHQDSLGIGELDTSRFAPTDHAALDPNILDLLAEQQPVDPDVVQDHAPPVIEAHRQAPAFIDGHPADFDIRRAIGPFPDMKHPETVTSKHLHPPHPFPSQPEQVLAEYEHFAL